MFTAAISIYLAFLYLYNRRQTEKKIQSSINNVNHVAVTALHCTAHNVC